MIVMNIEVAAQKMETKYMVLFSHDRVEEKRERDTVW